jgi:signal transduction histidine kinase
VRRRILLLVVGMTVLVVLAFAIPLAILIRSSVAQDSRTKTLAEAARVTAFVQSYPTPTAAKIKTRVTSETSSSGYPISVTLASGTVIGSTPADGVGGSGTGGFGSSFPTSGASAPGGYGTTPNGTGNQGGAAGGSFPGGIAGGRGPQAELEPAPGGQVAVTRVPSASGPTTVRVYLSDSALHSGEIERWLILAGAAVVLILVGVVAGEILTRRIVRPLLETATTATALSSGDTTARAPIDGPGEVADVGRALNRLADRIDQLIAEERETVADLSHRLRTPLTALRLDAEALHDPVDAERMGTHVNALERMLTAVIHAARRPQREGRMPLSDATAVVGERVAFWSALAEDQDRTSSLELPAEPLPVRAGAGDLAAAVDALLENVIAHTPEGTPFGVRLTAAAPGARLEVFDDGPGLPYDEPVRGRSDRSSGLGLDIARRCAEASGGSMTLGSSPSGGALITLAFASP